jgi:hypothetical protein
MERYTIGHKNTDKNRNNPNEIQNKEEVIHPRFTDPLASFPGKVPTAAEMSVINKIRHFFENKKSNN